MIVIVNRFIIILIRIRFRHFWRSPLRFIQTLGAKPFVLTMPVGYDGWLTYTKSIRCVYIGRTRVLLKS